MIGNNVITVTEHQCLRVGNNIGGVEFDIHKLDALVKHYGRDGIPYYNLIHNGVRFNSFVGAIQVGDLLIQVLPKADLAGKDEMTNTEWRDMLISMILAVKLFDIENPGRSSLRIIPNSILDLYFSIFLRNVRFLLHTGLVKQYRRSLGNVSALKGSINFAGHIRENLTHQERFFVTHTKYDHEHRLHMILYKTLLLLKEINNKSDLHSEIGALLIDFPEMPDIKISEATFSKISFNRKTQAYKDVITIARMLLLRYHPDIKRGRNHVLALMFDMNLLWEKFIYATLKRYLGSEFDVRDQRSKKFWKPDAGKTEQIRPDIIVTYNGKRFILDTKWKNLNGKNPSVEDLRQLYVYGEYFKADNCALIYPGQRSIVSGSYYKTDENSFADKKCSVISIPVMRVMKEWQESISGGIRKWIAENEL